MTVYWSSIPTDWRRSVPIVQWLGVSDLRAPLPYPPVLDVVGSALSRSPTSLLTAASAALAPRWEELGRAQQSTEPTREDIEDATNEAEEQLVLYAAARAVSRLGEPYGWAFVIDPGVQPNLPYFIAQLARMAEKTGFTLACTGDQSALSSLRLPWRPVSSLRRAIPPGPVLDELESRDLGVLRKLAASRCGAPVPVALRLGLSREAVDVFAAPGPEGTDWIRLGARTRRRLLAGLDAHNRRRHAAELFDAWPPDGWDYLRRSHLAVLSADRSRLRRQHAALLAGYAITGREWLQSHLAALATATADSEGGPEPTRDHQIAAHLNAARMALRLKPALRANTEAARHLHRASHLAVDPVERLDLKARLANVFANQRTPRRLSQARKLYLSGIREIPLVRRDAQRAKIEITYLNGLALIDYIEGANQSALELEERAGRLAFAVADRHPRLAQWAIPLICVNTAKLLTARFNDPGAAIEKLTSGLAHLNLGLEQSAPIRRSLAQLYFAAGRYADVIRVLHCLCVVNGIHNDGAFTAFQDRLMLATAQFRVGDMAACQMQLVQLRVLAARVGSSGVESALTALIREVRRVESAHGSDSSPAW